MLGLVTESCSALCKPMDSSMPGSPVLGDSPGKNTRVDFHDLLQGIFQPTGWNQVSHVAGRFFTIWATRETQEYWSGFSSVTQSYPTLCNPMDCTHQAFLSITNSWKLLKLMSIESVIPSNHLILCCPLLLLPSIFSSIRVFSSQSVLRITWPKY